MRYEDKWRNDLRGKFPKYLKPTHNDPDSYDEDTTTNRRPLDNGLLRGLIVAAAVAGVGYGLYKSGAARDAIEFSVNKISKYEGRLPETFNTIKTWANTTDRGHVNSIFRSKFSEKGPIDNLRQRLKLMATSPDTVIPDTIADIKDLRDSVTNRLRSVSEQMNDVTKKTYANTGLMYNLGSMKKAMDGLDDPNHREVASEAIIKNILLDRVESAKDINDSLKRTGFRHLQLKDVLEIQDGQLVNRASTEHLFKMDTETLTRLNDFASHYKIADGGVKKSLINIADTPFMNMTIDSNLLINQAGDNIADLRHANDMLNKFVNSAALDFQIPIVGMNPIKMLGINKAITEKPIDYAVIPKGLKQPSITGAIGDVKIEQPILFMKGDIFEFTNQGLNKVGTDKILKEVSDDIASGSFMDKDLDSLRKMANIKRKDFKDFTVEDDGYLKYAFGKTMKFLDIGFQDTAIGDVKILNPLTYGNKAAQKMRDFLHPWKSESEVPIIDVFGKKPGADTYVILNKTKSLKQVWEGTYSIKDYTKQYFAGRNNLQDVTQRSLTVYHLIERLNQTLATAGLGMNTDNLGSFGGVAMGLLTKRVMPVYVGYQAFQYLNMETEKLFGTQLEDKVAHTAVNLDLMWHGTKDKTGLTGVAKKVSRLMPGGEQIKDIPGFGFLDMSKTKEEREDYWKNGYDPVRKGRYWSLGNTPLTGSKVEYHTPNWYRRTLSDYEFTDVKYGSREEFFKNSWMPTPRNPLAPIKHFITDRYHYEKKHYYDRPYMATAPAFEQAPLIGPLLSSTIGKIIKPQKKMHLEYWAPKDRENVVVDTEGTREGVRAPEGKVKRMPFEGTHNYITPETKKGQMPVMYEAEPKDEYDNRFAYITPGGRTKIVEVPDGVNLKELNDGIREKSARRMGASEIRPDKPPAYTMPKHVHSTSDIKGTLKQQYNVWSETAGIYGFSMDTIAGGNAFHGKTVMQTSGYMNSMNRTFWEQDTGGLGGDISEIYRRFFYSRTRKGVEFYNPIKNTMPDWIPGEDYFIDFQHGDPYMKVKRGEMRLPGHGYEAMYGIDDPMKLIANIDNIGKSKEELISYFTHDGDENLKAEQVQKRRFALAERRIKEALFSEEQIIDSNINITDDSNNIVGTYDARIYDKKFFSLFPTTSVLDIKLVSGEEFEQLNKKPMEEDIRRLQYVMHATEDSRAKMIYVNRDADESKLKDMMKEYTVGYDKKIAKDVIQNLEEARQVIKDKVTMGEIHRGDLYHPFERFRILADVAPYSKEFKEYSAMMAELDLTKEQRAEVTKIRERRSEQTDPLRIYPYRFKTANVQYRDVTISKKIDNNTFIVNEIPNNPIRLAGVNVSNAKGDKTSEEASEVIDRIIKKGSKVRIAIDADNLNVVSNDTYKTVKAVVYAKGKNLNRELLKSKLATEREDDWDPAAVHGRFSKGEIAFGKAWERVAHMDTFTNTKLLQVRSGLESYKRRNLYGKDFQSWTTPIDSILKPSVRSAIERNGGIAIGALIGSRFGKGAYGRMMGAIVGASTVAIGKGYKKVYEAKHNEKWIPKDRKKERELNEYVDILKFIKNRKLYEEYAEKAKEEDGFDVKSYLDEKRGEGVDRKKRKKALENAKRELKMEGPQAEASGIRKILNITPRGNMSKKEKKRFLHKYQLEYASEKSDVSEMMTAINREIIEIGNSREVDKLSRNAQKAIEHYDASEKTMYAYEPGKPLQDILGAMPKHERQYMKHFMDAPEEERMKILELVPRYMRRPLQSVWGVPVEDKPNLLSYFKTRQLPGSDWAGWEEDVDLDLVKVKMVKHQALDMSDFNMWRDDERKADALGPIPLPRLQTKDYAPAIRRKLEDLLTDMGVKDLRIDYNSAPSEVDVDINLKRDKKREIEEYIKSRGQFIL